MTDDGILMRLALDEASAAADRGDPGFGAVVARAGQTVAQASSTEVTHRNPLAHDGSPFSARRAVGWAAATSAAARSMAPPNRVQCAAQHCCRPGSAGSCSVLVEARWRICSAHEPF